MIEKNDGSMVAGSVFFLEVDDVQDLRPVLGWAIQLDIYFALIGQSPLHSASRWHPKDGPFRPPFSELSPFFYSKPRKGKF